jgi:hypothetical protein
VLSAFRLPRIIESCVALRLEEVAVLLMKGVLPLSGSVLQPGWSKRLAGSEADETLSRSGRERWVLVVFVAGRVRPGGVSCLAVVLTTGLRGFSFWDDDGGCDLADICVGQFWCSLQFHQEAFTVESQKDRNIKKATRPR